MSDETRADPAEPSDLAEPSDPADRPDDPATKEHDMTDQTTPIVEDDGRAGPPSAMGATGEGGAATASGATAMGDPAGAEGLAGPSSAVARRGPSVPTVVWGLLFGLVAAVVIVGQTSEVDLNLEVSAPLALLAAGVVLVVWGVAGLGRSRRTP